MGGFNLRSAAGGVAVEIKLWTLTPLWTGDAEGEGASIRESGILGSLRWWYEAAIRGSGGYACDPTSDSACGNNPGKPICPACELFGCNGQGKKFKLEVLSQTNKIIIDIPLSTREKHFTRGELKYLKHPIQGRYFKEENPLTIRITELRSITTAENHILARTFDLIEKHGGLGARLAQGNGVIKTDPDKNVLLRYKNSGMEEAKNDIEKSKSSFGDRIKEMDKFPKLDQFLFGEFSIVFNKSIDEILPSFFNLDPSGTSQFQKWKDCWQKYNFLPVSSHLRYIMRNSLPGPVNKQRRHELFGYVEGRNTSGSQVFVSHGYAENSDTDTIKFRLYCYGAGNGEIDLMGKALIDNIEQGLFNTTTDKKLVGHIKCNGKPLNGNKLSDLLKKGTDLFWEN